MESAFFGIYIPWLMARVNHNRTYVNFKEKNREETVAWLEQVRPGVHVEEMPYDSICAWIDDSLAMQAEIARRRGQLCSGRL